MSGSNPVMVRVSDEMMAVLLRHAGGSWCVPAMIRTLLVEALSQRGDIVEGLLNFPLKGWPKGKKRKKSDVPV